MCFSERVRNAELDRETQRTVMLLAVIVTTTCQLRTGVAHDIVRPLSNVAEIPASPARSGVELLAGQVRG